MPHCRIYLDQELETGSEASISPDMSHYLRHVMRLVAGDEVTIFNGRGGEYRATLSHLSKQAGSCHVNTFLEIDRELPLRIHVIQCANKNEKIETVLQKCTELGAASFQITSSQRSQFRLSGEKLERRLKRWKKIVIEAAEQSERTAIPTITWQPDPKQLHAPGNAYALHPEATTQWKDVKKDILTASDITLAIGPEGGWSRHDMESLKTLGFTGLIFGPRIMRTETAAPALIAAIQAILD